MPKASASREGNVVRVRNEYFEVLHDASAGGSASTANASET